MSEKTGLVEPQSVTIPAGTIVHIEGLPFECAIDTRLIGVNSALLRTEKVTEG